jgi:hypothetical protein
VCNSGVLHNVVHPVHYTVRCNGRAFWWFTLFYHISCRLHNANGSFTFGLCFILCYCRITCSYALSAEEAAQEMGTADTSGEGTGNAMNFYHPATGQRLLSVTGLHDT